MLRDRQVFNNSDCPYEPTRSIILGKVTAQNELSPPVLSSQINCDDIQRAFRR
jgi:hypothetical protein